ncbi:hypothetical protein SAMN05421789_104219 [Kaistella chaponensis]|uniref:Uncharacterized protein n=1 Tax=Kaistella chaponensis TaxID=713588 RepID=A0A1N7L4P1_9FLAO|nr:hypothetical protein [Kaistella chaponensis]SIS68808.1 hypothetical protein SAMN05421789_104219 [Kaistella chaponensis]
MDQRIFQELKKSSELKLTQLNAEFSKVMEDDFNAILENSVNRMQREGRISSSDIDNAKRNINIYLEHLAQNRERQFGGRDILRYKSLNESKSSICPLWPIC